MLTGTAMPHVRTAPGTVCRPQWIGTCGDRVDPPVAYGRIAPHLRPATIAACRPQRNGQCGQAVARCRGQIDGAGERRPSGDAAVIRPTDRDRPPVAHAGGPAAEPRRANVPATARRREDGRLRPAGGEHRRQIGEARITESGQ